MYLITKTDLGFAFSATSAILSDFAQTTEGRITAYISLGVAIIFAGFKIYDLIKARSADGKIDGEDIKDIISTIQDEVTAIKDEIDKTKDGE